MVSYVIGSSRCLPSTFKSGCGNIPLLLSVLQVSIYAVFMTSSALDTFANPGMPPKQAQDPYATTAFDFLLTILANYSLSLLVMAPS